MLPTITVDIGTTAVKLCLFDEHGALLEAGRQATPTVADGAGEVYDVDALRGVVTRFIRGLDVDLRMSVQRIAISGVGESGGLVREDGSLASPMILWHDQRGAATLAPLTPEQRSRIYRITGLPVSGNYGLSKVAWAVERATDPVGAVWLNIAEYLAALMSGERCSEPSLASRTMALDLVTGEWSEEVCAMVGLDVGVFPELRPADEGAELTGAFAAEVGLGPGVRVHVAGHDHMVGAVGAALRPGELLGSTGTTEGLLYLRDAPSLDEDAEHAKLANGFACGPLNRADRAMAPRDDAPAYTLFASIPTGGSAFATLQQLLGVGADRVDAMLAEMHARYLAGGIRLERLPLVLPQFRGSPPPTKNPAARGMIAGIRTDTSAEEIVFGTFLGMVLQFQDVLELFRTTTEKVKVIGPASRNPLWLQLKADLLGTPLSVSSFPEVVSRGAQALASNAACTWEANGTEDVLPDPARHERLLSWRDDVSAQWKYLKGAPS